ncbi:hypothetical protein NDU88_004884 [Pleurodeles waltl]|uniref:Uncharacterized protein n=1 Tax=Pleurodeles waltl TaxID=8319 RepID=A0AAV7PDS1_PLEWA|nr:hypothetical protein NDU88_004884 [Pleurodeles waltl]
MISQTTCDRVLGPGPREKCPKGTGRWPRAEEEEEGHISRAQRREKSVSAGTKEEDGDVKERRCHERERRSPPGTGRDGERWRQVEAAFPGDTELRDRGGELQLGRGETRQPRREELAGEDGGRENAGACHVLGITWPEQLTVQAGAAGCALIRGDPGPYSAARERRDDSSSSCEETRAGLLSAAPARVERNAERAGGGGACAGCWSMWPGEELIETRSGRADLEARGRSRRVQHREKSVSAGTKEEDGETKEGRGPNARGDRRQEPEETEKDGGKQKPHFQETRNFGIEAESYRSVTHREKSVSAGTKEEDGETKEGRGPNARGDRRQEPEETEKDGGKQKPHFQETRNFGIEAESYRSVTVRRDNPEEKNYQD